MNIRRMWNIDLVREEFQKREYILISNEYKNNKQKLQYICSRHDGVQTIRLADLLNGHGCHECGREIIAENNKKLAKEQRRDVEDVRKEIESYGFKMISDKYKNARTKLKIQCPKGHTTLQRIGDFRRAVHKCRKCYINSMKLSFEEVEKEFENRGYKLLSKKYVNSTTPLKYICNKHPDEIRTITMDSIRGGHGCYECGIEAISGKNSVHYNPNLSEEDRKRDRRYDPKEREWRIKVFKRDKFTCQKCGKYSRNDANAHHKDAHHWCVERRYDVDNGVTLCSECHQDFHKLYGYKHNTESQYIEWIKMDAVKKKGAIT